VLAFLLKWFAGRGCGRTSPLLPGGAAGRVRGRKQHDQISVVLLCFVASAVGAALITGAASAQTVPPVPAAATNAPVATVVNAPMAAARVAKPQNKRRKKVTPSFVVVVSNSRSVALSELDATPSGGTLPKTIVSNLAPGQKLSVTVATEKSCVFNLHGVYADGSSTDSTSVDLCKDKRVNLVE
jgi:hypothetical protein